MAAAAARNCYTAHRLADMTDPRTSDATVTIALSDEERGARVEQLLVAGLDEYFAGRLDQAMNVWTRVLFLDRANDRARAYIDRARRAQAELQRESEALLHEGLQAFDQGDVERARQLLVTATERGAPHEQALPVLHRIGLLDLASAAPGPAVATVLGRGRPSGGVTGARPARSRFGPVLVVAAAIGVAALVLFGPDAGVDSGTPVASIDAAPSPLPVPASADAYLARAEALFGAGKLADALVMLDRVDAGDSHYRQAQELRGRVQRVLLNATAGLTGGIEGAVP